MDKSSVNPRTIAIVGRPNVGKSALFNRLVRRRLAIVHEESGVTRDRLVSQATWHGEPYEVIDTGGLAMMDQARLNDAITESAMQQVQVAIEDAAVVLFVVDITAGIVPMDQEVSRLLKRSGRPILVAANKADRPDQDALAMDFSDFGYSVFPISAAHNRGMEPLMNAAMQLLPPATLSVENIQPLRVAVVGRPNVGKSSYINRLLGHDRVIVSDVPGTTRDSVEIPFSIGRGPHARHYVLIDTAGMRKAGRVHASVEKFSIFRAQHSIEEADVVVQIIDAEQGPSDQDKKIAAMIQEARKGCVLLVNKWDLAQEQFTEDQYRQALLKALFFLSSVPVIFASAKSGFHIRKTIETIDHVARQVQTKISTGVLNRVLHDAFKRVSPPSAHGRFLKFYYAVQTGIQPVRISLFVNNTSYCAPAYRNYLMGRMREAFGLEGAPLVLQLRSSHEESSTGGQTANKSRRAVRGRTS